MDPQLTALIANLAEIAARNSASAVFTRIKAVRTGRGHEETINELIELINDLVDDRNQLLTIARALEDELTAQKITDDEITFITDQVVPTIENLMGLADDSGEEAAQIVDAIKKLLTPETLTILQLIGFNFKAAIGQPLTELVASHIASKNAWSPELQVALLQQQLAAQAAIEAAGPDVGA